MNSRFKSFVGDKLRDGSADGRPKDNSPGLSSMFQRPMEGLGVGRSKPPAPAPAAGPTPPAPDSYQQGYFVAAPSYPPPPSGFAGAHPAAGPGIPYHPPQGYAPPANNGHAYPGASPGVAPQLLPTPPAETRTQSSRPAPWQAMSSGLNPFGSKSKQDDEKPRSAPMAGDQQSQQDWKDRLPKGLRGVANLADVEIDGSVLNGDLSIRTSDSKKQKKEGLCSACSRIDFDQFDPYNNAAGELPPPPPFTHKLLFLDRILRKKKRGSCRFCELLFDAIAQHDPLEHPAVKEHLPKELRGTTFKEWAEGLDWRDNIPLGKSTYPFGRSRDTVELQTEVTGEGGVVVKSSTSNEDVTSNDVANGASLAAVAGLNAGIWTETDTQRVQIMATVGTVIPTITSLVSNLDAKLPVAVSIILHNTSDPDAGLLNVDVWGYGNAHRAPLSRLSSFNLRVASGYRQEHDGSLVYAKRLGEHIDVENDCKLWLDTCTWHHGRECEHPNWWNDLPPPSGPHFRLLDVNAMRVVQISAEMGASNPKYAALSYVWGSTGRQALNLHLRNLEHLSARLDGQVPPIAGTIRDAINVTRRLGLPYLWVDSLCIIQNDEWGPDDAAARASQIEQMDSIFGHAHVTLVAADGLDAESGLCGVSGQPRDNSTQIVSPVRPYVNVLLAAKYGTAYGKWDTRAWTLQEKLLSKRMLIFNNGYVSFHCRRGVLREDMPARHAGNGPPQIPWLSVPQEAQGSYFARIKRNWDGAPVILRSAFFSEYAALLAQYTSRDMTDSRDALNAVFGLLRVLERMAGADKHHSPISGHPSLPSPDSASTGLGHTLYGLPERFLDLALLWQPPAVQGVYLTKRPHDSLPSWSWAGWEVAKDPEFKQDAEVHIAAKPGVRFEEPFWVATNDDLSIRKVTGHAATESVDDSSLRKALAHAGDHHKVANNGENGATLPTVKNGDSVERPCEERYLPLVRWYHTTKLPTVHQTGMRRENPTATAPSPSTPSSESARLTPVNGDGVGIAFDQEEDAESIFKLKSNLLVPQATTAAPMIRGDIPLDNRHIVCETEIARFRLRRRPARCEKLWKRSDSHLVIDAELFVAEADIVDRAGQVVGTLIPTDARKGLATEPYDLVLLSEGQFWGDEERVDGLGGMRLYNVMAVEWDNRREFATRVGIGKMAKTAWWGAEPLKDLVILK